MNYYNEWDSFAAEWLRELIKDKLIPAGVVDTRSIADVEPSDIKEFTQCHFFAGIGGWSLALQLAGWSSERPVWTGSPPCQPFSTAGNRKGQDDERHLWPVFFNLIRKCQPSTVFGEQVAAAIRAEWFDDLQADMEAENYATAMAVLPACSVGAPHKRDRLFYVAGWLGNAKYDGLHESEVGRGATQAGDHNTQGQNFSGESAGAGRYSVSGDLREKANTDSRLADSRSERPQGYGRPKQEQISEKRQGAARYSTANSLWSGQTINCQDGKRRPIPTQPALFPLAHGVPNRVGILRGAGNAIVPQAAAEIVKAYMEIAR